MDEKILARVLEILEPFVREPGTLEGTVAGTRILEDLGVDPEGMARILEEAGKAFDVVLDEDDAAAIRTVGDMVQVIACKATPQAA